MFSKVYLREDVDIMTVLGILGIFAVPILLIVGLVAVFRKTGKAKKWFKISGGVFVAAIIILIFFGEESEPVTPLEESSTEVQAEEVEVSTENKAQEDEEKKAEETAKKEAEEAKKEAEEAEKEAEEAEKESIQHSIFADSFINDIGLFTDDRLSLSDLSYDFIVKNHSIFPAFNDADIIIAKELADSSITAKHLNKNAQPYFEKIATFEGEVISVEEAPAEVSDTISLTHIMDDNMQSYQVFMYKGTGDVLEDDRVRFWGVPVGASSFENVSGGSTNVQVFLGSHIEKVQ